MRPILRAGLLLTVMLVASTLASFAAASGKTAPVFFVITKSQNENQVHYAMHLDAECRPVGDGPVFAYWHMIERGPTVYEQLLAREQGVYGISRQTRRDAPEGPEVVVTIAALPKRPLVVRPTKGADGKCRIAAYTTLAGVERATIQQVHAVLAWPFGVRYLQLLGRAPDGRAIEEKATP